MRTFPRVLLLALGVLLGSTAISDAVLYEVSWVDVRFEPTYDQFDSRALSGHPSGMVPVTVNGSLVWDSDARQMVAGIITQPSLGLDRERWTVTGMFIPVLYFGLWESGQGTYYLFGETGFGAVIQFLTLSAPSMFPEFAVGIYDATTVPQNRLNINSLGGNDVPSGAFTPVSGEIRVAAVPEPPTWLLMVAGVAALIAARYRSLFRGGRD